MRYLFVLLVLISTSCNQQGISEEQRQKLKEEKVARKIQRVTKAEILNAAKSKADELYKLLLTDENPEIISKYQIKWIALKDSSENQYVQQMQEAYQYTFDQKLTLHDNIEDLGNGSIVFTKPDFQQDSIGGFWMIVLNKKEVIKGML